MGGYAMKRIGICGTGLMGATMAQIFAEKGYDATSIEDITATVGVAKGTLYYHFSSKEEIFNFLVEPSKMFHS